MSGEFAATDRFNAEAMQVVMRHPDIFWASADALSPQPEEIDFVAHLTHPDTWTVAGTYKGNIFGFVRFVRRTTVCAEIHVGFLQGFRGKIAKVVIQYAIAAAFKYKGVRMLLAIVPSDNRAAIALARHIGFSEVGKIPQAIVRKGGLRDLVLMTLSGVVR